MAKLPCLKILTYPRHALKTQQPATTFVVAGCWVLNLKRAVGVSERDAHPVVFSQLLAKCA